MAADRSHQIDYDNPPAELPVTVGDTIVVSLPQLLPSRWEPATDDPALALVDDQTDADKAPRGAAAKRTLTFEVRSATARELRLVRRRPWEQEVRETFVVPLRVT